tara:strand:- start:33 stop:641 length:609 start_codon:yes stop_codon:yes gene_type:complete
MTWLRNGNSQPDTGFTVGDVNYPAGWIKNAPQSERDKLNIVAAAPDPYHDQRFSWGIKSDGTENWKDLTELKKVWVLKQDDIAEGLLAKCDKKVIEALDEASTFDEFKAAKPSNYTTYRAAVRTAFKNRKTEINAASTAEELRAILTGPAILTQNKKDSDGNDIEHTDPFGESYDPKQYEQEKVGNPAKLDGKYPWPDAPTS